MKIVEKGFNEAYQKYIAKSIKSFPFRVAQSELVKLLEIAA